MGLRWSLSWLATDAPRQLFLTRNDGDPGSDLLDELQYVEPHLSSSDFQGRVRPEDLAAIQEARRVLEEAYADDEWLLSPEAILQADFYKSLRETAKRIMADLQLEYVEPDPIQVIE